MTFLDYDEDTDDSEAIEAYVADLEEVVDAFGIEPPHSPEAEELDTDGVSMIEAP